jgi:hypothetical protein
MEDDLFIRKLIGSQDPVPSVPIPKLETGVPSVPEEKGDRDGRDGRDADKRLPYLLADGTLVIPFDSPERYHWWKGGQSIRQTVGELKERKELDASAF